MNGYKMVLYLSLIANFLIIISGSIVILFVENFAFNTIGFIAIIYGLIEIYSDIKLFLLNKQDIEIAKRRG